MKSLRFWEVLFLLATVSLFCGLALVAGMESSKQDGTQQCSRTLTEIANQPGMEGIKGINMLVPNVENIVIRYLLTTNHNNLNELRSQCKAWRRQIDFEVIRSCDETMIKNKLGDEWEVYINEAIEIRKTKKENDRTGLVANSHCSLFKELCPNALPNYEKMVNCAKSSHMIQKVLHRGFHQNKPKDRPKEGSEPERLSLTFMPQRKHIPSYLKEMENIVNMCAKNIHSGITADEKGKISECLKLPFQHDYSYLK
eukprot:Nk52_evm1s162 gene=Nk52_evmTU1s162